MNYFDTNSTFNLFNSFVNYNIYFLIKLNFFLLIWNCQITAPPKMTRLKDLHKKSLYFLLSFIDNCNLIIT